MLCASCTLLLHSYQRILSAAIIPQHLSIICRTHPLSVALIYHGLVHTVFAREPAEAAAEAKHLQRLLKLNLNLLPLALSPPPPPSSTRQACTCCLVLTPALLQLELLPNSASQMFMSTPSAPCQREISTDEILRRRKV